MDKISSYDNFKKQQSNSEKIKDAIITKLKKELQVEKSENTKLINAMNSIKRQVSAFTDKKMYK